MSVWFTHEWIQSNIYKIKSSSVLSINYLKYEIVEWWTLKWKIQIRSILKVLIGVFILLSFSSSIEIVKFFFVWLSLVFRLDFCNCYQFDVTSLNIIWKWFVEYSVKSKTIFDFRCTFSLRLYVVQFLHFCFFVCVHLRIMFDTVHLLISGQPIYCMYYSLSIK